MDVKQVIVVPDSNPNGDELANSIDELANSNDELKATNPNDSVENLKELNAHCKQLGLCLRCQLRFLGELYSSAVFVGSETDLKDVNLKLQVPQIPTHNQLLMLLVYSSNILENQWTFES